MFKTLIDIMLPAQCVLCREEPPASMELCKACDLRLNVAINTNDQSMACYLFEEPLTQAIHRFKYNRDQVPLKFFHRSMHDLMKRMWPLDGIVPVPTSRQAFWKRGYNPAHLLAKALAKSQGLPLYDRVLKRIHHASSQTALSKTQRLANTTKAFASDEAQHAAIKGKKLVLVDDVMTTGATSQACVKLLKQSGVESVNVLVLARVA